MKRTLYLVTAIAVLTVGAQIAWFKSGVNAQTTTPTAGTVTFRYDSVGRLVQDVYPQNSGAYNYDAAGNRTSATQQ